MTLSTEEAHSRVEAIVSAVQAAWFHGASRFYEPIRSIPVHRVRGYVEAILWNTPPGVAYASLRLPTPRGELRSRELAFERMAIGITMRMAVELELDAELIGA